MIENDDDDNDVDEGDYYFMRFIFCSLFFLCVRVKLKTIISFQQHSIVTS